MGTDDAPRHPRRGVPGRCAAWFVAFAVACSPAPPPSPQSPAPRAGKTVLERYLPLEDDTVYSYETYSENSGERGVLVLRVRRPRPGLAELDVAGRIQRLYVSDAGLELATGGYLLLAPLRSGAKWRGDFGQVRVTSMEREVNVPAGKFSGCLETVEELTSTEVSKRTTTVFCPDVGIVQRETEGQAAGEAARESLSLKSYGKAFSLDSN